MGSDFSELLERVQKATGPDRNLDGLIYIETHIPKERAGRIDHEYGVVGWWPKNEPYQSAIDVPRYTDSVDAALALVERVLPGAYVDLVCVMDKPEDKAWSSFVGQNKADARTPALAILAALLTALDAAGYAIVRRESDAKKKPSM